MKRVTHGQGTLEYVIMLVILVAAFVTMQIYIKRGFQGRWKASVDEMGEQYDPNHMNSLIRYQLVSNSATETYVAYGVQRGVNGYRTMRDDTSSQQEKKQAVAQTWN